MAIAALTVMAMGTLIRQLLIAIFILRINIAPLFTPIPALANQPREKF